jgi:hypothetical protein
MDILYSLVYEDWDGSVELAEAGKRVFGESAHHLALFFDQCDFSVHLAIYRHSALAGLIHFLEVLLLLHCL